jgi:hypothetical protein
VQTVRPALERFYRSLSDEQKARFNAIAPTDDANAAGKDQRDLAKFCDEKSPSVTDLPIDRIGQAVQPTPTQRATLDDLKDASVKAAEDLKVSCPAYQMLTPTGRVEAMEKRLDATLGAVKTVQHALAKFHNSLSDVRCVQPPAPRGDSTWAHFGGNSSMVRPSRRPVPRPLGSGEHVARPDSVRCEPCRERSRDGDGPQ